MRTTFFTTLMALTLAITSAFAQKASDLKYYDVRQLGLPIVNQGFKDCVRQGSSAKDALVKGATEHDAAMQKPTGTAASEIFTDEKAVNDGYYTRLPARIEGKVRQAVWDLGQCGAGIAVRFRTNSKTIGAKWTLLQNLRMSHMAPSGICGFDLYGYDNGEWRFVGTAQPNGKQSLNIFHRNLDGKMREYVAFFPLYDGVINLALGIDENAIIEKPENFGNNPFGGKAAKPLVFYGTSITQGGCASRPGMVYTNILSRKLGRECINLGFSGNGRMDKIIAEEMARIDAGAYIIDCLGNCTLNTVRDSTLNFIKTLATAHPNVPIIMLSNYYYSHLWIDKPAFDDVLKEDALWYSLYKQMRSEGLKNLRFINIGGNRDPKKFMEGSSTGPDNEGSVDGAHLTDLGFLRMANFLYPHMKKLK